MARRHQPFQMRVDPQHLSHLVDQGRAMQTDEFILRVYGDQLTAHWPSSGLYDSPPTLTARVTQGPDGVLINGTVRESFNDAMWQPTFLGLTVFMTLLAAFGVVTLITGYASGGIPPLVIGAVTAPAFLLLWRHYTRNRGPAFDRQIRELEKGMHQALTTGSTSRFD